VRGMKNIQTITEDFEKLIEEFDSSTFKFITDASSTREFMFDLGGHRTLLGNLRGDLQVLRDVEYANDMSKICEHCIKELEADARTAE
jgi:hypothetical protein